MAAIRILFGAIWLVDAGLKWSPSFTNALVSYVSQERPGQPGAVKTWLGWWISLLGAAPHVFAYLVAAAESVIAVGLVLGAFTNLMCVGGAVLSLAIWSTAEAFGGPYNAGTTDVGTSLVYAVLFVAVMAGNGGGWASLDRRLRPSFGPLCAAPTEGAGTPGRIFLGLAAVVVAAALAIGLGVAFVDGPAPPGTMEMGYFAAASAHAVTGPWAASVT